MKKRTLKQRHGRRKLRKNPAFNQPIDASPLKDARFMRGIGHLFQACLDLGIIPQDAIQKALEKGEIVKPEVIQ